MSSLDVETVAQDGQALFRSQRARFNGTEITTPLKALNPSKFRSDTRFDKRVSDFNEIYKKITSDKIESQQKNPDEHDKFCRLMGNLWKKHHSGSGLSVCIMQFLSEKPDPFPHNREIEFLADVSHSFSDIVPMPVMGAKINGSNFGRYIECMDACYNTIEELNNKPIMGILPTMSRELYPKLLEFYLEKQIFAFCFDFAGGTPNILKLRPILRHLSSKKILDKSLIYGTNARPGHALKNTNVIPAKDFIAYGFGLDILGENHIPPAMPSGFIEKMKRAADRQRPNKKRLFIKSDYGYYKTGAKEEIAVRYPDHTRIRLEDIFEGPSRWQSLFNMEQQSLETDSLRGRLNSLDGGETIMEYIEGKDQVKREIDHLRMGRKSI